MRLCYKKKWYIEILKFVRIRCAQFTILPERVYSSWIKARDCRAM